MSNLNDNGSKSSLYLKIVERIKKDNHHLPPHSRLPSRVSMMKRYGVTRTTIEKAISELNGSGFLYSLNGSGTYLSDRTDPESDRIDWTGRSAWGVVLPSITEDLYPNLVRGIEDVASRHNIHVVLCNTDNDADKQHCYLENLSRSNVKGIIIVPAITGSSTQHSFSLLQANNIPFIFCNRAVDGVESPRVVANNFYGTYAATKYLIGMGHVHIAFICAPLYSVSDQRYQGYLGAMHESGLPVRKEYVLMLNTLNQEQAGQHCADQLFSLPKKPDAIVCFNDTMAKGVYYSAEQHGIEIGKDVAVIGNGDTRLCEMLPKKLTSIRYPSYETGSQAANILLQLENGERITSPTVVLQPELIIRESCGER